ncbi:MAG: hypothetical protein HKM07_07670 [Chlamydiae bacterium]|nr:hypothetical protein [Chlamydiota bacterium]
MGGERSLVERSYDQSGRLIEESIFLNLEKIQETHQSWNDDGRSLQIGNHRRDFYYQNGRLAHLTPAMPVFLTITT